LNSKLANVKNNLVSSGEIEKYYNPFNMITLVVGQTVKIAASLIT